MAKLQYELMRPQEILAARDAVPVAYLPMGPLEWHGPHLPFGVDMLHGYAMALETARQTGGVVLPPLPMGTETYLSPAALRDRGFRGDERVFGMDFPKFSLPSLYLEESAMGVLIREFVRALKRQKFRVIVIVNGHGGANHRAALIRIAVEESEPGEVTVLLTGYPFDTQFRGHAELGEAAFMLAAHPETVDMGELPPLPIPLKNLDFGVLDKPTCLGEPTPDYTVRDEQDPRHATPSLGQEVIEYEARQIAAKVREALTALMGSSTGRRGA